MGDNRDPPSPPSSPPPPLPLIPCAPPRLVSPSCTPPPAPVPPHSPTPPFLHPPPFPQEPDGSKSEYRIWNPFRSKLAAGILLGMDNIFIAPGSKVLYLGAASGTSVSHVSDLVGPTGLVYAVEFSHRSGRDLINMAKTRPNIIPVIEDARHPLKYRMLVGMVDTIFADVAQPDQARIVTLNASYFLKNGGAVVISIKANCIDSTVAAELVFAKERENLKAEGIKLKAQITLEPFERDHAIVTGIYVRFRARVGVSSLPHTSPPPTHARIHTRNAHTSTCSGRRLSRGNALLLKQYFSLRTDPQRPCTGHYFNVANILGAACACRGAWCVAGVSAVSAAVR